MKVRECARVLVWDGEGSPRSTVGSLGASNGNEHGMKCLGRLTMIPYQLRSVYHSNTNASAMWMAALPQCSYRTMLPWSLGMTMVFTWVQWPSQPHRP